MVKSIQCYEDATGKLHKCAYDAHCADLAHWFARSNDINDASAKKLVDWLIATPEMTDTLIDALKELHSCRPSPPIIASIYEDVS